MSDIVTKVAGKPSGRNRTCWASGAVCLRADGTAEQTARERAEQCARQADELAAYAARVRDGWRAQLGAISAGDQVTAWRLAYGQRAQLTALVNSLAQLHVELDELAGTRGPLGGAS